MTTPTLSLLPKAIDLQFPRGLAAIFNCWFQDATTLRGLDITDDVIELKVRKSYGGEVVITATATLVTPATGLAQFSLTASQLSDGKTSGKTSWVYVITRVHAGGEPVAWFGGAFDICETAN